MDPVTTLFGDNKHFNSYLVDVSNIKNLNAGLMELEESYSMTDRTIIRTTVFNLATELLDEHDWPTEMDELTPREKRDAIMDTIDFAYYIMQYVLGWLVIIGSVDKLDHMRELGRSYALCTRILTDLHDIENPDICNICRCYSHNELIRTFQENIMILLKGSGTTALRNHYKDMIVQFKLKI
jgi:hypothetical protein